VEVDHSADEAPLVEQLELHADAVREGPLAAPHDDRREEQVAFVDQPGPERLGGELGTAHGEVAGRRAFSRRTASGSKARSIRVLALDTVSSVLEYTTLSAACQSRAKSSVTGDWSARVCAVSQKTIVSYIRRP
jgi:hypothetical protein